MSALGVKANPGDGARTHRIRPRTPVSSGLAIGNHPVAANGDLAVFVREAVVQGGGAAVTDLASATAGGLLQCIIMGRLENIIARNQRPNRPRERLVVSLSFGAIVLLILGLMVFTDLGLPPGAPQAAPAPAAPRAHSGRHLNGVLLRAPTAPAAPAAPAAPTVAPR